MTLLLIFLHIAALEARVEILPFAGNHGTEISKEIARSLVKSEDIEVWEARKKLKEISKTYLSSKKGKYAEDFLQALQGAGFTEGNVIAGNISPTSDEGQVFVEVMEYSLSSSTVHVVQFPFVLHNKTSEEALSVANEIRKDLVGQPLIVDRDVNATKSWEILGSAEYIRQRKMVLFPGLISILVPGSGHLYTGEYLKGGLVLAATIGSLALLGSGSQETRNGKTETAPQGWIGLVCYIGLIAYGALDAEFSAMRYNRRLLEKMTLSSGPGVGITVTRRF